MFLPRACCAFFFFCVSSRHYCFFAICVFGFARTVWVSRAHDFVFHAVGEGASVVGFIQQKKQSKTNRTEPNRSSSTPPPSPLSQAPMKKKAMLPGVYYDMGKETSKRKLRRVEKIGQGVCFAAFFSVLWMYLSVHRSRSSCRYTRREGVDGGGEGLGDWGGGVEVWLCHPHRRLCLATYN